MSIEKENPELVKTEVKTGRFPAFRDPPPLGERWFEEDSDEAFERAQDRETREEEP